MTETTNVIDVAVAKKIVNDDPFCDVRLTNIENNGRKTDKFMIELFNPDTSDFQEIPGVGSVHSVGYKLITNKAVHDMAAAVMNETKLNFEHIPSFGRGHSNNLYWNGRVFSEKWFCRDASVPVPGTESHMMLGMEVNNSYDGSTKVGLSFFAMHVACSNQFYGNNLIGRPFEFTHANQGGDLNDDIGDAMNQIKLQAASFGKIAPNMKLLQGTHVDKFSDFLDLRNNLRNSTRVEIRDKQLLDELSGHGITNELKMEDVVYNDPSSYWDIVNAYTAVTTHVVGGPRGSDQCGRVVDWMLKQAAGRAA